MRKGSLLWKRKLLAGGVDGGGVVANGVAASVCGGWRRRRCVGSGAAVDGASEVADDGKV